MESKVGRLHPKLTSDFPGYDVDLFCIPDSYRQFLDRVLIPGGMLRDRIDRIAQDILEDFQYNSFIAVCILKGGYKFFTDLLDSLSTQQRCRSDKTVSFRIEFIRIKSYSNTASGEVQIIGMSNLDVLRGRNVLVVEDIIDTGRTMNSFVATLKNYQPLSIKVVTLLMKTGSDKMFKADYIGFEIPVHWFVVGFALDYNEMFRDVSHLCLINEKGKQEFLSNKIE